MQTVVLGDDESDEVLRGEIVTATDAVVVTQAVGDPDSAAERERDAVAQLETDALVVARELAEAKADTDAHADTHDEAVGENELVKEGDAEPQEDTDAVTHAVADPATRDALGDPDGEKLGVAVAVPVATLAELDADRHELAESDIVAVSLPVGERLEYTLVDDVPDALGTPLAEGHGLALPLAV